MTCDRCGSKTPRRGLCKRCSLDERHTPARDEDASQSSVNRYECTACGTHYRSDGGDECPECGSRRRRYAGEPQTDDAREAVALVYHTIGLIKSLSPDFWFLENPQGYLRQVLGQPTGRVTFCQYGTNWMKPTDLWGKHPPIRYRACSYGDSCHAYNTDQANGGTGNCRDTWYDDTGNKVSDPAKRAKVPHDLSAAIRDAVEADIENPSTTQATLIPDGDAG